MRPSHKRRLLLFQLLASAADGIFPFSENHLAEAGAVVALVPPRPPFVHSNALCAFLNVWTSNYYYVRCYWRRLASLFNQNSRGFATLMLWALLSLLLACHATSVVRSSLWSFSYRTVSGCDISLILMSKTLSENSFQCSKSNHPVPVFEKSNESSEVGGAAVAVVLHSWHLPPPWPQNACVLRMRRSPSWLLARHESICPSNLVVGRFVVVVSDDVRCHVQLSVVHAAHSQLKSGRDWSRFDWGNWELGRADACIDRQWTVACESRWCSDQLRSKNTFNTLNTA